MAKIDHVDYEAMPRQAKAMREYALELNNELRTAYSNVGEMHNSWYGVRYNELVKDFNELIPQVNDLLKLVVTEIPFAVETIANNYAQADKGQNVTSAEETSANNIENLPITNDVGMRFMTAEVANTQRSVSEKFDASKELMNKIEAEYNRVEWQSEASESFKARFNKLKNDILMAFDNINNEFSKLMTQTQQDIETTEKANTVQ
ncbi:MAG: WXG100 family type VII secretion target [Clostridia bacterium]|nr:unknown [Clostridium sp. CAG:245]